MNLQETRDDPAALLANFFEVLAVKVQAGEQTPTEIPDDLKTAVLQLISHKAYFGTDSAPCRTKWSISLTGCYGRWDKWKIVGLSNSVGNGSPTVGRIRNSVKGKLAAPPVS